MDLRMMQNNRIPRWLVENDPSWERSIDSNIGVLKWTKKGSHIQAVCHPTSMFCDIVGQTDHEGKASDLLDGSEIGKRVEGVSGLDDITKFLSSRYLNPSINGPPRFDLRKIPKS